MQRNICLFCRIPLSSLGVAINRVIILSKKNLDSMALATWHILTVGKLLKSTNQRVSGTSPCDHVIPPVHWALTLATWEKTFKMKQQIEGQRLYHMISCPFGFNSRVSSLHPKMFTTKSLLMKLCKIRLIQSILWFYRERKVMSLTTRIAWLSSLFFSVGHTWSMWLGNICD